MLNDGTLLIAGWTKGNWSTERTGDGQPFAAAVLLSEDGNEISRWQVRRYTFCYCGRFRVFFRWSIPPCGQYGTRVKDSPPPPLIGRWDQNSTAKIEGSPRHTPLRTGNDGTTQLEQVLCYFVWKDEGRLMCRLFWRGMPSGACGPDVISAKTFERGK